MIPTQREYEEREAADLRRKLAEVEAAPLSDRRKAAAEYAAALAEHPEIVAERVDWLLAGSYGYGSYRAALRILADKQSNRPAQLAQLIAALEWGCSSRHCREAYQCLTVAQQADINQRIEAVMSDTEAEQTEAEEN